MAGSHGVLGLGFLAGQWMAWRELAARGFYLATSPSSSMVYLLPRPTPFTWREGCWCCCTQSTTGFLHRPVEGRRIVVDVTAWYWHFMAFVWIYIFALLEFVR